MSLPVVSPLASHPVVSPTAWLAARRKLLEKEKAFSRERDRLCAERRELPWVLVEKDYVFEGPDGPVTLAELFDGRSQLLIYHFMFGPGWQEGCGGCSFLCDHIDGARLHFPHGDLSFAAVSRAPLAEFAPFKRRMGWRFPWVSSFGSDFNYDFGVSFTEEQVAKGEAYYNYEPQDDTGESHGLSVFYKDADGRIYHTYSTYARGAEEIIGAFMLLDFTPKGRNERDGVMNWVRLHDRYDDRPADSSCC